MFIPETNKIFRDYKDIKTLFLNGAKYLFTYMCKFFILQINGITGAETSFIQLESEILSVANGFRQLGLQKGDVVCLYGTNRTEFAHVFCGVTANGAILTIANSQLTVGM